MQVKASAVSSTAVFMELYEFCYVHGIYPANVYRSCSDCFSDQRGTGAADLDLMLTTRMSAGQIVTGKLLSALSTLFLLILSSFPAVAWYLYMEELPGQMRFL